MCLGFYTHYTICAYGGDKGNLEFFLGTSNLEFSITFIRGRLSILHEHDHCSPCLTYNYIRCHDLSEAIANLTKQGSWAANILYLRRHSCGYIWGAHWFRFRIHSSQHYWLWVCEASLFKYHTSLSVFLFWSLFDPGEPTGVELNLMNNKDSWHRWSHKTFRFTSRRRQISWSHKSTIF